MRLNELKELLLERNYPRQLLNSYLDKARLIPRKIALKRVIRKKTEQKKDQYLLSYLIQDYLQYRVSKLVIGGL